MPVTTGNQQVRRWAWAAGLLMVLGSGGCNCIRGCLGLDTPPATPASATAPPRSVAPDIPEMELRRVTTKMEWFSCKQDDDCILVPADCCGCASGGRNQSIHKSALEAAAAERRRECPSFNCSSLESRDPTCVNVRAACVNSTCQIQSVGSRAAQDKKDPKAGIKEGLRNGTILPVVKTEKLGFEPAVPVPAQKPEGEAPPAKPN